MIVFCCFLPASNKARDDDDDLSSYDAHNKVLMASLTSWHWYAIWTVTIKARSDRVRRRASTRVN